MTRFARCVVILCVLSGLALTGCASWARAQQNALRWNYPHAAGETLTQSGPDHAQAVSRYVAHDARALVEDLDLLFLTERSTRLTRWHDR
ncbi:MAG: hypothetical protein JSU86_08450 [Phycisphaerales bacterium]|nr:MAG: hypothetical protein JSU86_08450 [Phycisphaerales bacterium]